MSVLRVFLVAPFLSFIWLLMSVLWAGQLYSEYHHGSQFISELAATGTAYGALMNYGGFLPTEIFMLVFCFAAFQVLPKSRGNLWGLMLIAAYAISLVLAAVFPCDLGCRPEEPTLSHELHLLFGMGAYALGLIGIALLFWDLKRWHPNSSWSFFGLALAVVAAVLLVNFDPENPWVGWVQRATELTLYSGFTIFAWVVYQQKRLEQSA